MCPAWTKTNQDIKRTLKRLKKLIHARLALIKNHSLRWRAIRKPRFSRAILGSFLLFLGILVFFSPLIYKKYINLKAEQISQGREQSSQAVSSGEAVSTGPVRIDKSFLTEDFSLADLPKSSINR